MRRIRFFTLAVITCAVGFILGSAATPLLARVPETTTGNKKNIRPVPLPDNGGTVPFGESRLGLDVEPEVSRDVLEMERRPRARILARRFLEQRGTDLFGMSAAGRDEMSADAVKLSPIGAHVRFTQVHDGRPVFNGGMKLHVTRNNRIASVHNRHVPFDGDEPTVASYGEDTIRNIARDKARERLGSRSDGTETPSVSAGEATLGYLYDDATIHLAYRVSLYRDGDPGPHAMILDANDGTVLRLRKQYFTTHNRPGGRVFEVNPVFASGDTTLRDNGDTNTGFDTYYTDVSLDARDTGTFRLTSDHVDIVNLNSASIPDTVERPYVPTPQDPNGDFYVKRHSDTFEAVMAFHHINKNHTILEQLGFPNTLSDSLPVDVHGLDDAPNGMFVNAPSVTPSKFIVFGDANKAPLSGDTVNGVDFGEDADVILHEYGHAIHSDNSGRAYLKDSLKPMAQAEGFADYWASTNTPDKYNSPSLPELKKECQGEWVIRPDPAPPSVDCLRRFDLDLTWPEDRVGEEHMDGRIWAKALWDIEQKPFWASDTLPEQIVLTHHTLVPDSPTFREGSRSLLRAADHLGKDLGLPFVVDTPSNTVRDGGNAIEMRTICNILKTRGLIGNACAPAEVWHADEVDDFLVEKSVHYYQFSTTDSGFDLSIELTGATGTDFDLRVWTQESLPVTTAPDSVSVDTTYPDTVALENLASGTYVAQVHAFSGTGSYVLTTGSRAVSFEGGSGSNNGDGGILCLVERLDVSREVLSKLRAVRDHSLSTRAGRLLTTLYYTLSRRVSPG